MCGIISLFSNQFQYKRDIDSMISELLSVNTLRGVHSTGIMYEDATHVHTFKKAMSGFDFIQLRQVQKIIRDYNESRFIVGHNRAATAGAVNTENAHPFQYGHITGVHNGTITNHRSLVKGSFTAAVDSEYIFKALEEEEDTTQIIKKINGAFVLIWYNSKTDKLHFVKNDQRPYTFANIKDTEILIGASEEGMLRWIAKRNSVELENIVQPKPLAEMIFNFDDLLKPDIIQHEGFKQPVYFNNNNNNNSRYSGYNNNHNQFTGNEKTARSKRAQKRLDKKQNKDKTKPHNHRGKKIEFVVKEFCDYQNTTNSLNYGRFIGEDLEKNVIIIYQCYEKELQVGCWYEGICHSQNDLDNQFTIQRTSVKKIVAGIDEEEIFSCTKCEDFKSVEDLLFVDQQPYCFSCCQDMSFDVLDDGVEFNPPKKIKDTVKKPKKEGAHNVH